MGNRLDGKVVLVTGGARGQGRSHAVRMAEEGAQIVVCDIAAQIDTIPYPMATPEDVQETARLVESTGQACLAVQADVRDPDAIQAVVDQGVATFGKIDCGVVNHGVGCAGSWDSDDRLYHDVIDVNVHGVFHSLRAIAGHLISRGAGGSIVVTASAAGSHPIYGAMPYIVSKAAAIGMAKSYAVELAPHNIRVNVLNPGLIDTPMNMNDHTYNMFAGTESGATKDDLAATSRGLPLLDVPWIDPVDMAHAAVYLVSDESRSVTGTQLTVDAGASTQPPGIPWQHWGLLRR